MSKQHVSIRLTEQRIEWVTEIGGGSLTVGIDRVIDIARGARLMLDRDRNLLLRDCLEVLGKFRETRGIG